MEPLETSTTLLFHGVAYVVTVCVRNQMLEIQVEVEDKQTPLAAANAPSSSSSDATPTCWTAQFPATYVEDLTRKTGNYKRFPVFVNMLLSAMAHRSDAVFIDLLTTSDLELYRKRKMGGGSRQSQGAASRATDSSFDGLTAADSNKQSKRYLILTYAVEFDRVHYPLPLNLVETPTPEILQRTIRRLRQSLARVTKDSHTKQLEEEMRNLREENRCLKATLSSYCDERDRDGNAENAANMANTNKKTNKTKSQSTNGPTIDLHHELELSMKENKELISIYQQLRENSSAEMAQLKAEIKQLKMSTGNHNEPIDRERVETRRRLNDSNAAAHEALLQLQEMKIQLDETQLKNKQLMRQLAIARVKGNNAGVGGHGAATSTRPSATATASANRNRERPAAAGSSPSPRNGATRRANPRAAGAGAMPRRGGGYMDSSDDDEEDHASHGYHSSSSTGQRRGGGFRRFDPTAYQEERKRKLQQRAAAASASRPRSPSPNSNRRTRGGGGGGGGGGGYTSDSSAGGYSSAGSDASRGSTRSRGRSRVSYQHQRDADARLASPRRDAEHTQPPVSKPPLPRYSHTNTHAPPPPRGRSPSPSTRSQASNSNRNGHTPAPSRTGSTTTTTTTTTTAKNSNTGTGINTSKKPALRHKPALPLQPPPALLADTSMDSFSDIDDRLTALQQFLQDAKKQGTSSSINTHSITTSTAVG